MILFFESLGSKGWGFPLAWLMVAFCLLRQGIEERNLLSKGLSGLFLLGVGGGNISVWFQGNHDPVWVERDRATENTLPQKPHDDDA